MSKKNRKQGKSKNGNKAIVIGMLIAAIALGGFNLIFYGVNVFSLGITIMAVIILVKEMIS